MALKVFRICIAVLACAGSITWAAHRLWPRRLMVRVVHPNFQCEIGSVPASVGLPGRFLLSEVARYDDEMLSYLMFTYLRRQEVFRGREVLLTYRKEPQKLTYVIAVRLENNLFSGLQVLSAAERNGLISSHEWRYIDDSTLVKLRSQSLVFVTAYNLSSQRKIDELKNQELRALISRFVRFKSMTDPRIRKKIEPVPNPLTSAQARQFAADIVMVADFYELPLDLFLGIGAMENNYMNIKGDLKNMIWKRRAEKGDVVVKRQRGRVLVMNESSGVWQITRESLRFAHGLYLGDKRDYSLLPDHLRPSRELDLEEVKPEVLTTYAGLLFRYLLDHFWGDATRAVAAYNGGMGNPNFKYEEGVRAAAEHARRIIEQAATLQGQPAAGMWFIGPAK